MPSWLVVGVESSVPWPTTETKVEFRGYELVLRPAGEDYYASVAFCHPREMSYEEALLIIRHYLSSLTWVEQRGIREVGVTAGSAPFQIGSRHGNIITRKFRHDYLPDPSDPQARLALAFYREALSLNNIPYSFLGFFKILNIRLSKGDKQIAWVNIALTQLRDTRALERLAELRPQESDIGKYLYESGRCAVAHAFAQPLVNPENAEDTRRLARDLPLVQALAELFIEKELKIKTRWTVGQEHLYHLAGFRELLGEDLIARLKSRAPIPIGDVPAIPLLSIRVRDQEPLDAFEALHASLITVDEGVIWLSCMSQSGPLVVILGLDLADEFLVFDPQAHLCGDPSDRSLHSLKAQIASYRLVRALLRNGELEIIETISGRRLGLTDPYFGQNIDLAVSLRNIDQTIEHLQEEVTQLEAEAKN